MHKSVGILDGIVVFLKAHNYLLFETDMSADKYPFKHSIAAK